MGKNKIEIIKAVDSDGNVYEIEKTTPARANKTLPGSVEFFEDLPWYVWNGRKVNRPRRNEFVVPTLDNLRLTLIEGSEETDVDPSTDD